MRKELLYLVVGLACGAGLTLAGFRWFGGASPESYDDCILEKVKPGLSDHAAALISRSCREVFPEEPPSVWSKYAATGPAVLGDRSVQRLTGQAGVLSVGSFGGSLYNGNASWRVKEVAICLQDRDGEGRLYEVDVDISPRSAERFSFDFLPGSSDESPAWSIVFARGEATAGPEPDDGDSFSSLDLIAACARDASVRPPR